MEFEGKRAIVTGGSSGIGIAVARLLAAGGAKVVIVGRDRAKLSAAVAGIGHEAAFLAADLTDPDAVEAMIATGIEILDGLDILINNAGSASAARATDLSTREWRRMMAINLDAVFLASRAALPRLIAARGNIVCTSSIAGLAGDYGHAVYGPAKAAVLALVRGLAVDYALDGVRVNAVSPGFTITGMTEKSPDGIKDAITARIPMQRAGSALEIAEAIAFLASDRASYITGQNLIVDGGMQAYSGLPNVFASRAML